LFQGVEKANGFETRSFRRIDLGEEEGQKLARFQPESAYESRHPLVRARDLPGLASRQSMRASLTRA